MLAINRKFINHEEYIINLWLLVFLSYVVIFPDVLELKHKSSGGKICPRHGSMEQ